MVKYGKITLYSKKIGYMDIVKRRISKITLYNKKKG